LEIAGSPASLIEEIRMGVLRVGVDSHNCPTISENTLMGWAEHDREPAPLVYVV
jgi:hypothetical protein